MPTSVRIRSSRARSYIVIIAVREKSLLVLHNIWVSTSRVCACVSVFMQTSFAPADFRLSIYRPRGLMMFKREREREGADYGLIDQLQRRRNRNSNGENRNRSGRAAITMQMGPKDTCSAAAGSRAVAALHVFALRFQSDLI